jgi:hypothetical protein
VSWAKPGQLDGNAEMDGPEQNWPRKKRDPSWYAAGHGAQYKSIFLNPASARRDEGNAGSGD